MCYTIITVNKKAPPALHHESQTAPTNAKPTKARHVHCSTSGHRMKGRYYNDYHL